MTPSLDRWTRGWRGPVLAALVALASILPGMLFLPATDRSEARLAEASAQMLEDHDFAAAAVDEELRDPAPLAVHWLQAAAAAAVSDPEARQIWAFRIPAALGAMLAAAACAWGGAALFGASAGFLAGVILGVSLLLGTAGVVDAPGALLCAGVTLAVSALARLRLAQDGAVKIGKRTRAMFWLGLALATASGGLVGPAAVGLTGAALWLADRRAPWLKDLGWGWGLILLAALTGPSLVAGAVDGGQPAPLGWLMAGSGERTPGAQLLMTPLLLSPFALLLPAALAKLAQARRELPVRIAACWLLPTWVMMEFARGQSPARGLIAYGALAWLAAAAAQGGIGRIAARLGAVLQVLTAAVLTAALLYLARRFGDPGALAFAAVAAGLAAVAGLAGAGLLMKERAVLAVGLAAALGLAAHGVALAGLAPRLNGLWASSRIAAMVAAAGLDPRAGVTPGPVAVVGYGEPSLDFALGGQTEALSPDEAAAALRVGRPVIVEAREEDAFLAATRDAPPRRVGELEGFNYASGSTIRLELYAPAKH
ncbi:MAG TPA: glycosyltransferase family 39 protein [Caulobacteraceae bacterium]|jgi:4-amino-4-deoxy-L-arabinose transferase-like glycosyltransferase